MSSDGYSGAGLAAAFAADWGSFVSPLAHCWKALDQATPAVGQVQNVEQKPKKSRRGQEGDESRGSTSNSWSGSITYGWMISSYGSVAKSIGLYKPLRKSPM